MKESFKVYGKVQGIMFRQTFIRACHKRNIFAGATNDKNDKGIVSCSISGNEDDISKLKNDLLGLVELNSWGCHVDKIEVLDSYVEIDAHEVTTGNVDDFKWTEGVTFFL